MFADLLWKKNGWKKKYKRTDDWCFCQFSKISQLAHMPVAKHCHSQMAALNQIPNSTTGTKINTEIWASACIVTLSKWRFFYSLGCKGSISGSIHQMPKPDQTTAALRQEERNRQTNLDIPIKLFMAVVVVVTSWLIIHECVMDGPSTGRWFHACSMPFK